MTVAAVHGLGSEMVGQRFGIVDGLAGRVLITGKPVLVNGRGSVPISWSGQVRGALSAGSVDRELGQHDVDLLCEVAELGAVALQQAEARQELEAGMRASVAALARAVDMRDPRPPQQAEQVVELAAGVARELGLAPEQLPEIRLAALLRDVGKLAVPDGILRKPGPLGAREWELVRRHPEWGGQVIFGIPGLEGVAAIVVHHHEHYDGRGYPDGLIGSDIPLASRIVAVCDAYGAMTCDRPYRPALRPITALRELERRSGSQFDPEAVFALTRAARVTRE